MANNELLHTWTQTNMATVRAKHVVVTMGRADTPQAFFELQVFSNVKPDQLELDPEQWLAVQVGYGHRRRIGTEAEAKVVESIWGAKLVQFLAALAVLPRSILKKRLNSSYSSNRPRQTRYIARQEIDKLCPPNRRNDLSLCFSLHPSSMGMSLSNTVFVELLKM